MLCSVSVCCMCVRVMSTITPVRILNTVDNRRTSCDLLITRSALLVPQLYSDPARVNEVSHLLSRVQLPLHLCVQTLTDTHITNFATQRVGCGFVFWDSPSFLYGLSGIDVRRIDTHPSVQGGTERKVVWRRDSERGYVEEGRRGREGVCNRGE